MKKSLVFYLFILSAFSFIISSCATSTGSRYSKIDDKNNTDSLSITNSDNNTVKLDEDFDISPYKTNIKIPEKTKTNTTNKNDIWFDYTSANTGADQKILVGTEEGYRVLVTSTDNLEDANQIKSEIENSVNDNEVYIDFEPPFYKVKSGDFNNQKSADNLRFKLNQLGYTEAKVIKETINVFK
ncbi:MAG: SPOR domain-containing protein [Ignavibacteriaceae bacterium]